jgi:quercetin dioxygenase-like cupin family protein
VLWAATLPTAPPATSVVTAFVNGEATVLAGDPYTVKRRTAEMAGLLGMLHFAIPPGGGPIPHVHHRDGEVFVVLEGRLSLYADGVRTRAAAGDVVCLPCGIPHGLHRAPFSIFHKMMMPGMPSTPFSRGL